MSQVQKNVSLRKLNTYGFEVIGRYFIKITNEQDLIDIFNDQYLTNIDRKLVLGGGSNLLFVDDYFDGLILHMCIKGFTILTNEENNDKIILKVGGGEKWMDLLNYTIKHGYTGLEYLAGIPGTVGGAPIQNIGAYGVELSELFVECQVFDIEKKCFTIFNKDACRFAYRTSVFKENNNNVYMKYIITHVTFQLLKSTSISDTLENQKIVDEILHRRSLKLPDPWIHVGNAGSFFANPIITHEQYEKLKQEDQNNIPNYILDDKRIKLLAGWLIEQCNWKGKYLGSAGTWYLHANILVNNGSTNGYDLWTLAKEIRADVEKRFSIRLEPEVHIIRMFKSIRDMKSSKLIIKKNNLWKNENIKKTIDIPTDKNVCVHLLFAAIGLRRNICFVNGFSKNLSYDVIRILQWIDDYNIANLHFSNHQSLTITPNEHKLIDLTTASFSRASIDIAGNILLTYGIVHCIELGGCQFTKRPIDRHLNLLVALGGYTDDGKIFYLKKDWKNSNDKFVFDCRTTNGISSVGVTIHAILSCCALPTHIQCKLTSIALELSVRTVIALITQYRPCVVIESERIIIFEKINEYSNHDLVLEHLPIDQIYLFTICSLATMLQFKIKINNFEYDQCITEYLKTLISITIDETNQHALFDGTTNFINDQYNKLICDIYPNGLPTDISPILTALFIARQIPFELIDLIYDVRNTQCEEFSKLGYDTIIKDNEIIYNGNRQDRQIDKNLYAHDIRSGVAVLLLALYHVNTNQWNKNEEIIIHQYEQIERGYGSLLYQKLCEFGFDIQLIYELSS
ncbi:unnamed protein product [Adineta steineri]|uniref:UDP-N-acetylmuramate dehydrogenase n=2 Tax=Adineta steineri TaxID=433720 RepID=A0A819Q0W1_9BILA|nr:unnamed protein product [Adineta steineri]CAF4022734.1 unnamed protein product [Adineta steineri]